MKILIVLVAVSLIFTNCNRKYYIRKNNFSWLKEDSNFGYLVIKGDTIIKGVRQYDNDTSLEIKAYVDSNEIVTDNKKYIIDLTSDSIFQKSRKEDSVYHLENFTTCDDSYIIRYFGLHIPSEGFFRHFEGRSAYHLFIDWKGKAYKVFSDEISFRQCKPYGKNNLVIIFSDKKIKGKIMWGVIDLKKILNMKRGL